MCRAETLPKSPVLTELGTNHSMCLLPSGNLGTCEGAGGREGIKKLGIKIFWTI